jgi:hypothetical protein
VTYSRGKEVQFLDYVSSNVIAVAATTSFCAAALEDAALNVYTPTGRRWDGKRFRLRDHLLIMLLQVDALYSP